jgi:peptidoglycan hydrolase-like protein with peptidoglycan-binding domain
LFKSSITQEDAIARLVLAEDTEYFIWIPNSEPRRYGAVFAAWGAVLIGIVCVCAIGNVPPRGVVDAYIGAEPSRTDAKQIVAKSTPTDPTAQERSRIEKRESPEAALMLSSHSKTGMPANRHSGLKLSQLSEDLMPRLQAKLGLQTDGEFDPSTEKALKDWQGKNGLTADGIAGPDTLMAMELYDLVLLKRGAHGGAVQKLQEQLVIGADGKFGPRTEKAVRDYQRKNGLVADGMAGPATLAHIKLLKKVAGDN